MLKWPLDEPIPATLGTNIPSYMSPLWTYNQEVQLEACTTALDWYELFSLEWLLHVEEQSRNYTMAMGRHSHLQHITTDNIR